MPAQSLRRAVLCTFLLSAAACGTPATTDSGVDGARADARTDVPTAMDTGALDVATDVPMQRPDVAVRDAATDAATDATMLPDGDAADDALALDASDAAAGSDVATDGPGGVAVGGACDPAGVTSVCVAGAACLTSGTSSVCVADGTPGAECNPTGAPCNAGLVCSGDPTDPASRCIAAVPVGGTCDPAGVANACVAASHCITTGRGATCIADGAGGGFCSTTPPACGTGLGCSGDPTDPASRCITAVVAGSACDPTGVRNVCAAASHCMTRGTTSTCVVDGTLNAHCSTTSGLACNPGLGCVGTPGDDAARCVTGIASGAACVPTSTTTACITGDACVTVGAVSSCRGYAPTTLPSPTLIDACATGTTLALTDADDGHSTTAQTLPFTLAFLGTSYTQLWPDTNGYVALGAAAPVDDTDGVAVPDSGEPAPAIAPFWDDLVLGASGHVCTLTTGTAPSRAYVIEWQGVSRIDHAPAVALTFEIVLHENNTIDFVYTTLAPTTGADAAYANGTHAAIGMQASDAVGLQYFGTLAAPFGIHWTPM